ncbi:intraflagellar transport protein 56 isoform X2 [Diachasma alloeum]|uniref:intraflagellar transport protein 56 isoform X2 n=1 Tax=Diachasma alloeum TaxID=454923 RepID=UPI0007382F95|nr:intraflagellar transport protein 56 isoform X2 [Diachasma alloeum]
MILSRAKPALSDASRKPAARKDIPKLGEFLEKRDYAGALTLIEFNATSSNAIETETWIAYCAFHLGDYKRATSVYEGLRKKDKAPADVPTNLACCYFYLGMYPEAKEALRDAPESGLKTRLLFHLSHKMGDENTLLEYHGKLKDVIEDQLCLASIHYLRAHYQEAIDIYKKILLDNRDYLALNVYVALCYYKLDYYDVAQEVLQVYLQKYPDSAIAINLKACNHFRLYDGSTAQAEMRQLVEKTASTYSFGHDLIRHNIVVFRDGEGALQVLPALVDVIPEARLNLVVYYLKQNDIQEAYDLIKDLEPAVPQEYILKGTVHALIGQDTGSRDSIKTAQQYFHLVGSSASECDTIPGRHCMAACFFLRRQFEEVLVYLNSIKTYFSNDDSFNFNYAQAQTASGYFKEAEEAFLMIRNERYRNDYVCISLLAYCYLENSGMQPRLSICWTGWIHLRSIGRVNEELAAGLFSTLWLKNIPKNCCQKSFNSFETLQTLRSSRLFES